MLLSSVFVYNQVGAIDAIAIERLAMVCELAKRIKDRSAGAGTGEEEQSVTLSRAYMHTAGHARLHVVRARICLLPDTAYCQRASNPSQQPWKCEQCVCHIQDPDCLLIFCPPACLLDCPIMTAPERQSQADPPSPVQQLLWAKPTLALHLSGCCVTSSCV